MSNGSTAEALPASPRALGEGLALGFALTILVSAFLLFQVQPLISKFILPWFGGSPAVWTTCLLFFQSVLFCGYAYAHVSTRFLGQRTQAFVHLALLAGSVALLPIAPSRPAHVLSLDHPTREVLLLLARSVGLPYFVLSSTGPLVQGWFSQAYPGRSPYRLYALSNFGSLVALVSYPFVFEPAFSASFGAHLWAWLFGVFLLLLGGITLTRVRGAALVSEAKVSVPEASDARAPTLALRVAWLALPAFASVMLLATTNNVCENVAVVPFLWVAPLALYLLSFIVAFDARRWYRRPVFAALGVLLALAVGCIDPLSDVLELVNVDVDFLFLLVLDFALLFVVCMICHGELVRLSPSPAFLTEFYLYISAGGALGGMFVSLFCPAFFHSFFEWTLGLCVSFVLALFVLFRVLPWERLRTRLGAGLVAVGGAAGVAAIGYYQIEQDPPLEVARNFYGVVAVYDVDANDRAQHHYSLTHGIVVHGRQFRAPEKQALPLAYYSEESGVGRALRYFADEPALKVGAVGLGVGTIARYAKPGQEFRFYEINPEVRRLAERYFTYLSHCQGRCELVMGDARLSLEREPRQDYHLLVLDAFSGDAVPAHLLTQQAFSVYLRQLREDGVIAVNITNHQLDLAPVLAGLAKHYGLSTTRRFTRANAERMLFRADWVLMSKNERFLAENPPVLPPDANLTRHALLWTDDYSNLFQLLK